MFGYVTIDKGELLYKDYETYKAIYCSLCKQLGKDYSFLSRFILSYDCTFYALVSLSLKDDCTTFCTGRCKFNPLKKCNYLKDYEQSLSKAAALSVITAYFKLVDNIEDGGFFTKVGCYMLLPFFSRWRNKARKRYVELDNAVALMSERQRKVEKDTECFVDMAADPTAQMLSDVMELLDDKDADNKKVYKNFGYFLGKWIYLSDALNDYSDDIKHKNFNPFYNRYGEDIVSHIEDINGSLNYCLSQVLLSYNFMDTKRFDRIITNILTLSLPKKQKTILNKYITKTE